MEQALQVENLSKTYRRRKRQAGLLGAVKALFGGEVEELQAVRALSFSIKRGKG